LPLAPPVQNALDFIEMGRQARQFLGDVDARGEDSDLLAKPLVV
jgi:hypothetical protein